MPTLEVKPGVSLFYLDSGAPDPSNDIVYVTLFILHGVTFHSPIFNRAIAISRRHNIRFVAITRRDYQGSSSLTDKEVQNVLRGPTEKRLEDFTERAEEIMLFMQKFIDENDIPPIGVNGGGFSLCGWSLGNLQGLSVLGFGNRFPKLVEKLTPYFREYILYETTIIFTPETANVYSPLTDESIPKEDRGICFCHWISSYFTHSAEGLASGNVASLNQDSPSDIKHSTMSQLAADEQVMILDLEPARRADIAYYLLDPAVNEGILRNVFSQLAEGPLPAWPNIPVKSFWGEETAWPVVFTQRKLEDWIQQLHGRGKDGERRWVRTYESHCIPGAHHFFHWDEPKKFLETIGRLIFTLKNKESL